MYVYAHIASCPAPNNAMRQSDEQHADGTHRQTKGQTDKQKMNKGMGRQMGRQMSRQTLT